MSLSESALVFGVIASDKRWRTVVDSFLLTPNMPLGSIGSDEGDSLNAPLRLALDVSGVVAGKSYGQSKSDERLTYEGRMDLLLTQSTIEKSNDTLLIFLAASLIVIDMGGAGDQP